MNIDIRLSLEFFGHPKIKKLQKRLGLEAVFALIKLWAWSAGNRPDGILTGLDAEDIELCADWDGEEGKFVSMLTDLRLLDANENGNFCIHDWAEHQAYASKSEERSAMAKRAAEVKWAKRRAENGNAENSEQDCGVNAESMPEACAEHAKGNADLCGPHANSNAPETRNQEEKNKNIYTAKIDCEPTGSPPSPAPVGAENSQPCLRGKKKKLTGKRVEAFVRLWEAFEDKRGKADAIDAFADIPTLTDGIAAHILYAAKRYAQEERPTIQAKNGTPKMLQGWLTARRWEDYSYPPPAQPRASPPPPMEPPMSEEQRKHNLAILEKIKKRLNPYEPTEATA